MAAAHPPVLWNNDLSCESQLESTYNNTTASITKSSKTQRKLQSNLNKSSPTFTNKNQVYGRPSIPSSTSTILTSSSGSTQSLNQQQQQVRRNRLYGQQQQLQPAPLPLPPQVTTGSSGGTFSTSSSHSSLTTTTASAKRWAMPTNIKEVQALYEQVLHDGNKHQQLELCHDMMQWIQHIKNELFTANNNSSHSNNSLNQLDKSLLRDALEAHARTLLRKLSKSVRNLDEPDVVREAQYLIATCYGSGAIGFAKDVKKACAWYIQSSKMNHQEATYRAGVCYEMGLGIKQDFGRAMIYYQKGARLSHPSCMYRLGVILLHGYYKQAAQPRIAVCWLQRAADSVVVTNNNNYYPIDTNCPPASTNNSSLFSSFSSFSSSSSLPFSSSFSSSISSLLSSTTAISAEADALPYALHALAMVQLTGECDKTSLIADPPYAISLLHRAAKMGYEASQCKLAEFYETGTWVTADDVKSITWYACAAKQGSPEGALGLSGWYMTGSNTPGVLPQSDRESFLWAKRAANTVIEARDYYMGETPIQLAVANGCYLVGHYLENGIGTPRNRTSMEEAVLWYHKAACLGHRRAIKRVKYLALSQEKLNQDSYGSEDNNNTKNNRQKKNKNNGRSHDDNSSCQFM